ncbi:MAG: molybdopterin-guanine dinucleotide biosynthesis protein B [Deltaproteobacteria bacterium]|nr:molybdopterin-guanine dinucleotide biosynthesis protein B [Deltaproteobacteria bacterium]
MGSASSMKAPLLSIVGLSGSGKTTLLEKLIAVMAAKGLKVGTIKHSRHPHPMDSPGKDSWRHKNAGAARSIFIGPKLLQLVSDVEGEPSPGELAGQYLVDMDIVLVEGFLNSKAEKIEVVRRERSDGPVSTPADGLIAVATDLPANAIAARIKGPGVECFDINDAASIAGFIEKRYSLKVPAQRRLRDAGGG